MAHKQGWTPQEGGAAGPPVGCCSATIDAWPSWQLGSLLAAVTHVDGPRTATNRTMRFVSARTHTFVFEVVDTEIGPVLFIQPGRHNLPLPTAVGLQDITKALQYWTY